MRVAGAQIAVTEDIEANVAAIRRGIEFAAAERADVLLTPEGSLSGYSPHFDREAVLGALDAVTSAARDGGIALALGTCFVEADDGRCYNQVRLYEKDGTHLGFHSKTLTCGTLTDPPRGEISDFAVAPLRTFDLCGTCVGALICNDLWANPGCTPQDDPHLTQQLSRMGARVIFHAVNGGRSGGPGSELAWQYHESNLRMRAMAGGVWIVTVDSCHPTTLPCSAPSGIIDPLGEWVVRAPEQGEALFVGDVEV